MPIDESTTHRYIKLLQAAGVAQAAGEPLDVGVLAEQLDVSPPIVHMDLHQLAVLGLVSLGDELDSAPLLLKAGRQYLAHDGVVPYWELRFLGNTIDDLLARKALLHAGTIVVDEFRDQILSGEGAQYAAAELVPPAFASAVDERLTLDLYAASVSLMARLSADRPAGCVAEEILAVALIEQAKAWLEMREADGEISTEQARAAAEEMIGLFELFQDDDVLDMFEMEEPADAALARHDAINRQLGVADQRIQSWFDPFSWTAPTGYLTEPAEEEEEEEEEEDEEEEEEEEED
jgi:hypothetical protein